MVAVRQETSSSVRRRHPELISPSHWTEKQPRISQTITWAEIPDWLRDNEFIISGYRRVQNSWQGCFISIYAYLHNETINIHSHLWGAVLFIWLLVDFNFQQPYGMTWLDSAVFNVFLCSAVFCLSASAFFHAGHCHSENVAASCHALDYSGIVLLTVGSFYPFLCYGFYCQPHLQVFYGASITLVGLGAAITVLNPEYAKPTHRGMRTFVFVGLGLCGIIPVFHFMATHGSHSMFAEMGVGWLLASGGLYIFGALMYANRIPERWAPGRFDYFFASHQLFHFCVVLAALAHYRGMLQALDHRLSRLQQLC